jgi:hypothetical protein
MRHDAASPRPNRVTGTGRVHPQVLSRGFEVGSDRAELPPIRYHDVRHSYATAAVAAGVAIKVASQRLGHVDIAVTLRLHVHVLPGDDTSVTPPPLREQKSSSEAQNMGATPGIETDQGPLCRLDGLRRSEPDQNVPQPTRQSVDPRR